MRTFARLFAGMLALALAPAAAGAAALDAYGQLPSLSNFAVSPNGTMIAYATFVDGKRTVLVNTVGDGKVMGGMAVDTQKLRDIHWADNDHLLVTMSVTRKAVGVTEARNENFMTQSYSLSAKKADVLLEHGAYQMNIVLGDPMPRFVNGLPVAFVKGETFVNQQGVAALFVEDLNSGRKNHIVEIGSQKEDIDWFVDETGAIYARTKYEEDTGRWTLQIHHGAGYTNAYSTLAPVDLPSVLGITPDGKSVVILSPTDGVYKPKQFSLADDKPQPAMGLPDGLLDPVTDPVTHRMIGVARDGLTTAYTFFDPADQAMWTGLVKAFPDENVVLISWSDDRKQVIVRVDGKRDGAAYFLIDRKTHKASFLGAPYAGIEVADIAERKLITYTAADGTKIPAFLTLPSGKSPKGLPLVVVPHGGPEAHDDAQFDWLSQALASRGYAVLQPEFRGSDLSTEFVAAGYGQWGRKMQTDLSDGVRYLAGQGTIDAKRVCIVGASYGGYAALAGATLDKGVYRCAVSDSGVSDPAAFLHWKQERTDQSDTAGLRYWNRFMGSDNMDDPKLAEISPVHHAAQAEIPILLIHGKDDTVVPIDQSEAMETALKAAGKPVSFVRLDREDHWLSTSETRMEMLKATVNFLETNNPPN